MLGDFVAFYLSDHEFKTTIELNKKFEPSYQPYLSIRIVHHYNETVFDGLLCRDRIFDRAKCVRRNNPRPSGIIIDDYNDKN